MTKSKDHLDKLIQDPAIEKVLRAELKRYRAEQELRQQEKRILQHEAKLALQVKEEAARQQRQRDAIKHEHQVAAKRMKQRIDEAKRHIAENHEQITNKAAANMRKAEDNLSDLKARRDAERQRRHEADEQRIQKFKNTKAAFARAHEERIESLRAEQAERAEKMAKFEADRDAFWAQRKEEGQKQLEHGVQNAQETEQRRLKEIERKARRAERLRAKAESERQADLAARKAERERRHAEAARLVKQQQRRDEQRRLRFAAETRAQQRRVERKKNKEAADLAARVDAKKKYISDPAMRKQLLDRLIELDKDKDDRTAIREILAGIRPSMVATQVTALASSAPVTPGTVTSLLGTAASRTGGNSASEATRRGHATEEAPGSVRLTMGVRHPKAATKVWGDKASGLKKARSAKKSKVAPR